MKVLDFEAQLERLWVGWYGAAPGRDDGDEPQVLRRLRWVAERTQVFGFENELLPATEPASGGIVRVIAENQSLWWLGYVPDGTDEPDGVVADSPTSDERLATVANGLAELLYRAAVIEAVFSGPWASTLGEVEPGVVDDLLTAHLVVPELTDGEAFSLPSVWDLGDVLVMGFGGGASLYASTRDPYAFAATPLGRHCRWSAS